MNSSPTAEGRVGWPAHVRPGAVRFARASNHYDDTIAFYRDLVGLPIVDSFTGSFGEDGTIFGLPDTTVQMEVVRAHGSDPAAGSSFDQLTLYLDNAAAVARATERLRAAGLAPAPPHPYWAANGAVVHRDPDGRDVVFAPWVYGRDPDPIDRHTDHAQARTLRIDWYDGDRHALRALFEEAEDSRTLDGYLGSGRVLVARRGEDLVGHLQLTGTGRDGELEIKNMSVRTDSRGTGIGRRLIHEALRVAAEVGVTRMLVATAAADVGNLRFYQRCGFRFLAVERDAFTPATGYPEQRVIGGIALLDRVWFAQDC